MHIHGIPGFTAEASLATSLRYTGKAPRAAAGAAVTPADISSIPAGDPRYCNPFSVEYNELACFFSRGDGSGGGGGGPHTCPPSLGACVRDPSSSTGWSQVIRYPDCTVSRSPCRPVTHTPNPVAV